jgi:D-alanyl-D-alanine carboxypeptidase/D-alanyl-D-alanine-endopeptidase (penicillin-binding protein 4)
LSQDPALSLQYAGELIAAFIERAGGSVKGHVATGSVPKGLEPVYIHRQSRKLSEILVELLRASNNYIANQVFLEIAGHRLGGPVSLEKSRQIAHEMLAAHELDEDLHLEEGAGISRGNRFTARGLAKLLAVSRLTPTCSAAMMVARTRPARSMTSARWQAMPAPPNTGRYAL